MEFKGQSKPRRREEGDVRNAKWRSLTPAEQFKALGTRPGNCKRQRAKILKLLEGK